MFNEKFLVGVVNFFVAFKPGRNASIHDKSAKSNTSAINVEAENRREKLDFVEVRDLDVPSNGEEGGSLIAIRTESFIDSDGSSGIETLSRAIISRGDSEPNERANASVRS
jgi:hypothetical protein